MDAVITEQDEAKYMAIMAGYDAAMLAHHSRGAGAYVPFQADDPALG